MKHFRNKYLLFIFYTFIWCALNESYQLLEIMIGLIISGIAIYISDKYFDEHHTLEITEIKFLIFFRYIFVLLFEFLKTTFKMIALIINGKLEIEVVELETKVKDPLYQLFIALGISATPGCVTIDKLGESMKVYTYAENANHINPSKEMLGEFEDLFMRGKENGNN